MTRWMYAGVGILALGALTGCAAQTGSAAKTATPGGGVEKTLVLGATRLDPSDLTMAASDVLVFISTAGDPLQLEFIRPADQAGKINCRVEDPKSLKAGEQPWATFAKNAEGHLMASIPPGRFPSVCRLAPGAYSYVVHTMTAMAAPSEEHLGQEGSITVH